MTCGNTPIASDSLLIPFVVGTTSRCSVVNLYNYTGERNIIDKSPYLTLRQTIRGQFRYTNIDLINPTITIDMNTLDNVNLVSEINYIYLTDFERYYYVESKNFTNTLCEIELTIDVLYTYKDNIMNIQGVIDRGVLSDNILVDPNVTVGVEPYITMQEVAIGEGAQPFFIINNKDTYSGNRQYVVSFLGAFKSTKEG